jgi:hypothetical protein
MSLGASLIQSAISRPAALAPKPNVSAGARARLELAVLALAGAPAAVEPQQGRVVLAPGSTFSVRVELMSAGLEETDAVDFTEAAFLSLHWEGAEGLSVQPEPASLSPEDINSRQARREFWLKTDPGAKGVQGRLVLSRRGARGAAQELRSLELRVEAAGAGIQLPEALRDRSLVDLELAPTHPEATAFLHVEATDKKLRLHWFPSKVPQVEPIAIFEPPWNLLDAQGQRNTEKILGTVRDFFRRHCAPLLAWLNERVEARSDFTLIIQEQAETRVPWEMLELHLKKERGYVSTPIGALIKVVRWLTVADPTQREGVNRLKIDRQTWSGQALSYVAEKELEQAKRELEALKGCRHERFDDIEDLWTQLQTPSSEQPTAMLFIASHGRQEQEPEVFESPLTRLTRNLPLLDLQERPMVFINACYSGVLQQDKLGLSGLPEILLGTSAGAYLGVLGEVEEGVAATIGERILRVAREKDGVCIPELLRTIRKEAFAKLDPKKPETRAAYVYTFMYVFYGTPEAWLKLEPVGAPHG